MKAYAAKKLDDNSIMVIHTNGDPEQFLPYHMETQGAGTEEDPEVEVKVMDAELVGEMSKNEDGSYKYPDKYFRNCWRVSGGGSVSVNTSLARTQRMNEIRAKRDELLKKSDAKYMELLSKGSDLTDIQALKQSLRDVPQNTDLSAISDLEELKAHDAFAGLNLSLLD